MPRARKSPAAPPPPAAPAPETREALRVARAHARVAEEEARLRAEGVRQARTVMRAMMASVAYKAADRGSRRRRTRSRPRGLPDAVLDPAQRYDLVMDARDMDRNDPVAISIVERETDLVVADGLTPRPLSGDEAWDALALAYYNEATEDLSHDGEDSIGDIQRSVFRAAAVDGDHGAILVDAGRYGRVQQVDSLRICSPAQAAGRSRAVDGPTDRGTILREGVERWPHGPVLGYWITDYDAKMLLTPAGTRFIPADSLLFVSRPKPAGQTRGVPGLAPTMTRLDQLDTFVEATQVAAVVHAMLAIVFRTESTSGPRIFGEPAGARGGAGDRFDGRERDGRPREEEMEPGAILRVGRDDTVEAVSSTQPAPAFDSFVRAIVRQAAAVQGVPAELALLDFTGSNFAQSRAMMMFVTARLRAARGRFCRQFCTPLYRWLLARGIDAGRLPPHPRWNRVGWSQPSIGWFNPLQEASAEKMAVETNLRSFSEIQAARGRDWREVIRENAEYVRVARREGVLPPAPPGGGTIGAPMPGSPGAPGPEDPPASAADEAAGAREAGEGEPAGEERNAVA